MTKRAEAKYKIDRRMGENIWGRPRSPYNKREYGPGQHGQRRKGKATDFGTQLKAKQKVKGYYGNISERQFHKYYVEARRLKGDFERQPHRPARAPARRADLSGQIRADRVRRAPVRQSRPHQGQRPPGQHRLLSGQGRRLVEIKESSRQMLWCSKPTRSPSATCPTTSKSITPRARQGSPAFPGSPKCRIRRTWSRTWSSSSIRADDRLGVRRGEPRHLRAALASAAEGFGRPLSAARGLRTAASRTSPLAPMPILAPEPRASASSSISPASLCSRSTTRSANGWSRTTASAN